MPFASRILTALGEKETLSPDFDAAALARASPDLTRSVLYGLLDQFLPDPERAAQYAGRWDYPSGFNCGRKRAYAKFPDDYKPLPRERRLALVLAFGHLLEATTKWAYRGAGGVYSMEQERILTPLGHGRIEGVLHLNPSGPPDEAELYAEGYRRMHFEIKSMTPLTFNAFMREGRPSDTFGYRSQQSAYLSTLSYLYSPPYTPHPVPPLTAFVGINKVNCALGQRQVPIEVGLLERRAGQCESIRECTTPDEIPRDFLPVPILRGKKPNRKQVGVKLGVACSYCDYKFHCWSNIRVETTTTQTGVKREYHLDNYHGPIEQEETE